MNATEIAHLFPLNVLEIRSGPRLEAGDMKVLKGP
jgi:hypothetical protein